MEESASYCFGYAAPDAHRGWFTFRDGVLEVHCEDWGAAQQLRRHGATQPLPVILRAEKVRLFIDGRDDPYAVIEAPSSSSQRLMSVSTEIS